MFRIFTFTAFVCLLLGSAAASQAQVIFTQNENAFNDANPGLFSQDFQDGNVPPAFIQECGSIINESTDDECFSPGDILPGIEFETENDFELLGSLNADTNTDANVLCVNPRFDAGPLIINFDGPFSAVGLTLGCIAADGCEDGFLMNIEVFRDNNVIGETTVEVSNFFDTFLGITTSSGPIDSVILDIPLSPSSIVECLEDVRFGGDLVRPIPTLSEWGLVAMAGLIGMAGLLAVRRKAAA